MSKEAKMKLISVEQFNFNINDEHKMVLDILKDVSRMIEERNEDLIKSIKNDIINAFLQGVEMQEMFYGEGRCFVTDAEKLADSLILKYIELKELENA